METICLQGTRWLIGRSSDCDVRLPDPMVSRRHALLWLEEDVVKIRDVAARNPTLVNGKMIEGEPRVEAGDELLIGESVVEVMIGRPVEVVIVSAPLSGVEALDLRDSDADPEQAPLRLVEQLSDELAGSANETRAAQALVGVLRQHIPLDRMVVARVEQDQVRVLAAYDHKAESPALEVSARMLELLDQGALAARSEDASVSYWFPLPGTNSGFAFLAGRGDHASDNAIDHGTLRVTACLLRMLGQRLEVLASVRELHKQNTQLRTTEHGSLSFLGQSSSLEKFRARALDIARSSQALLVCGEAGSGKTALARYVHAESQPHVRRPFVVLDAAGESEAQFLRDLAGSSTDRGILGGELITSRGGTLCVRNVDLLAENAQRELAKRFVPSLRDTKSRESPIRSLLLCTTRLSPEEAEEQLCDELSDLVRDNTLNVPPLREHIEDLPLLAIHFLDEIAPGQRRGQHDISPRAMDRMRAYAWPGNLAELRSVLANAWILAHGETIYPKHLPESMQRLDSDDRRRSVKTLEDVEQDYIRKVFRELGGNKTRVAKALGIATSTLYEKLKKYQIGG